MNSRERMLAAAAKIKSSWETDADRNKACPYLTWVEGRGGMCGGKDSDLPCNWSKWEDMQKYCARRRDWS